MTTTYVGKGLQNDGYGFLTNLWTLAVIAIDFVISQGQ